MNNVDLAQQYRDEGYHPHKMGRDRDGKEWELISYPFPEEDGNVYVMVREKDRPTTIRRMRVEDVKVPNPTLCITLRGPVQIVHDGQMVYCVALVGRNVSGRYDFVAVEARLGNGKVVRFDPPCAMKIWRGLNVIHEQEVPDAPAASQV